MPRPRGISGKTYTQDSEDEYMEQSNDNFWLYIGGLIATIVVLIVVFKSSHEQAIPATAYQETAKEVEAQIAKQHQQK